MRVTGSFLEALFLCAGKEEAVPSKPNIPCKHPGCPSLIPCGQKYCEKHKALHPEEVRSASGRGYGSAWRKGEKTVPADSPIVCRVPERRPIREGNGCRPCRTSSRGYGTVLGSVKLAAIVQAPP